MDKKEIERLIISKFLEALRENALGDVTDHENPDFLLLSATPTLGIEITRMYREPLPGESSLKEQEVLRERVMVKAKKLYDAKGLPPIHVSVNFRHDFQLKKQIIDQTAEVVASLG